MKALLHASFGAIALMTAPLAADDAIDRLDDALTFSRFNDKIRVRLSGLSDLEYYHLAQPPPGLIYTGSNNLVNPRLILFLDAQLGSNLYAFAQARLDRGFDPSDDDAQVRLDTYAVRYSPWEDGRMSFQAGKFATAVGTWAQRSYSWDNPFITAPVPYENLTGIWDSEPADSGDELRGWSHVTPTPWQPNEYADKYLRVPIIWGPDYGTGLAVMGQLGNIEYNFEIKNSPLAARPETWDLSAAGFSHPTVSGRVGYRPNLMWNFGFSASSGTYLLPEAAGSLPPGLGLGDYRETLLGQDASFAWHHWQLWAEIFETRFAIPGIGNADVVSYYLEAKYKITPQLFTAARWNQQLFSDIPLADGGSGVWGRDLIRADLSLGYRFTEHAQIKLQYSLQQEQHAEREVSHLVASQLTLRF